MLFTSLPEVLGFSAVPVGSEDYDLAIAYAEGVRSVLDELTECFGLLLEQQFNGLLQISAERTRTAVMGKAASLEGEVLDPELRAFVLSLANDTIEANTEWAKAVATVVTKKAPAEWADEDSQKFWRELRHRFAAFHRLVALHDERRVDGGGPFDAYRVTVTRSDGSEVARLVGVDQDYRHAAEGVLNKALRELGPIAGSSLRADHTLLALLSERFLDHSTPAGEISGGRG